MNVLRDTRTIVDLRACQWLLHVVSGQRQTHVASVARLFALMLGLVPAVASAQTSLNVRLQVPPSSGLLERVRGQVNDLPVVIQAAPEADVRIEIGASALSPKGWRIECHDHLRNERQAREVVSDDAHPLTQSAADEAAALVIRSLLQAILRADQDALAVRVDVAPIAVVPTEPASPESTPATPAETGLEPPVEAASGSGWIGAGAQVAWVTTDGAAESAVWGRAGWSERGFAVGLEVRYGLGARIQDAVAITRMATHALLVVARLDAWTWASGALSVMSSLGTHLWSRRDARALAGWEPTKDTLLWSPSVGVGAEMRVVLTGGLALSLALGLDVLTRTPTLDRRALDGQVIPVATLSWFEPRLALGLELSL